MQKAKSVQNLTGHITNKEKERRRKNEERFKRDDILIQLPEYLNDDTEGQRIWCQVLNDSENFGIFDNLDRETLGSYCSITSRIIDLRKKYMTAVRGHRANAAVLEISKELRMLEAQQLAYAGKMGLTPESRARLAQKATEEDEEDGADLYG